MSRLLPTPASPTSRSAPPAPLWTRKSAPSRASSSERRPTSPGSSARYSERSRPGRGRMRTATSGSFFPFTAMGGSGSNSTSAESGSTACATPRSATTSSGPQAFWRRAATFTASPSTVKSQRPAEPTTPLITVPAAMEQLARRSRPGSSRASLAPSSRRRSWISRAALTARAGAPSTACGAPKTIRAASPMNLSMTPPQCSATSPTTPKNRFATASTRSGSCDSESAVKPHKSTKSTATWRRSARVGSARGAASDPGGSASSSRAATPGGRNRPRRIGQGRLSSKVHGLPIAAGPMPVRCALRTRVPRSLARAPGQRTWRGRARRPAST